MARERDRKNHLHIQLLIQQPAQVIAQLKPIKIKRLAAARNVFDKFGERFILQGVNRNDNFIIYKYTGQTSEGGFSTVFKHRLAGAVSAVLVDGDTIYAGTSLGFLSAYDMQGNRRWLVSLNGGIRYIAKYSSGLIVIELDGTMYRLSLTGKIETISMDSMTASRIIEDSDRLIIAQGSGLYSIMKEPADEEY